MKSPSRHQALVYNAFVNRPEQWLSHDDIVNVEPGIAPRTARAHAKALADAGLLDRKWMFPSTQYRLSTSIPVVAMELRDALLAAIDMVTHQQEVNR